MVAQELLCTAVQEEYGLPLNVAPYGRKIASWLRERYESGESCVCLVPARTETRWWHSFVVRGEVRFLRGRVKLEGEKGGAPFPSAVVLFGPTADATRLGYWDVNAGELGWVPVRSELAAWVAA